MDSKMDFDEEMSSLQIEDLGEYFLQTDLGDSWKGFSLGYTDEESAGPSAANAAAAATAAANRADVANGGSKLTDGAAVGRASTSSTASSSSGAQLTSPPLASITEMMRQGNTSGGLNLSSPRRDFAALFQSIAAAGGPAAAAAAHAAAMSKAHGDVHMGDEAMELSSFSLDSLRKTSFLTTTGRGALPFGGAYKSSVEASASAAAQPSPLCQNILSSGDEADSKDLDYGLPPAGGNPFKRTNSTLSAPEDDRGYRKKSREKMRRQEVNVKFDELVDLLGLSNRVRKSAILQEAVSAIKALKREREEMRRDRDRLQQEVSKLATCLQYSHLGSVANAVAMSHGGAAAGTHQMPPHMGSANQLAHLSASASGTANTAGVNGIPASAHTHPLNVQCSPGNNCFPIGGAFGNFSAPHAHSSGMMTTSSSTSGTVSIAPKALKPAPSAASTGFKPIAPDPSAKH